MNYNIKQTQVYLGHNQSIYDLCLMDAERFLSAAGDGYIVAWSKDQPDGQLIAKADAQLFCLDFNPAQKFVWTGDMNGGLYIMDFNKRELLHKAKEHQNGIYDILCHENRVYTVGGDGILGVFNSNNFELIEKIQLSRERLRFVKIFDEKIFVGGADKTICVLDLYTHQLLSRIKTLHTSTIFDAVLTNGKLISGSRDAHIQKQELENSPVQRIPAHNFTVNSLSYCSEKNLLVSGSRDKSIKLWSEDLSLLKVIDQSKKHYHINSVNKVLWINENQFLSASDDRSIRLWTVSFE